MIDPKSYFFLNSVKTKNKENNRNAKEIGNHEEKEKQKEEEKLKMIKELEDLLEDKHIEIPGGNDYFLQNILCKFFINCFQNHIFSHKVTLDRISIVHLLICPSVTLVLKASDEVFETSNINNFQLYHTMLLKKLSIRD